jgi:CBS domain containing-hemolysin-like protein
VSENLLLLTGAIALVVLGSVFAAVDAALNTLSPARVDDLVKGARLGAGRLARLLQERPRYINILVLLRIACEITATVLVVAMLIDELPERNALLYSALGMLVISFVIIGVGPRTLGRQHAYTIALVAALPLQVLGALLSPLSRLMILLGNAITPGKGFSEGPFSTETELRELVDLAEASSVIESGERRMIHSVFDLGDTIAREVMVPRNDVVYVERHKNLRQTMSLFLRSGFSRVPVIGENLDDILGFAYLKDVVRRTYNAVDVGRSITVGSLMRPAVFVPDSKRLDALLREMQRDRNHIVMLVDEYGGIAGMVTIEDVLEEIVGEINDEYDTKGSRQSRTSATGCTGCPRACRSRTSASSSTSPSRTMTSRPWAV